MSDVLIEPVKLRAKGFQALVGALGWVNAVRFIQQYEASAQNYTAARDQILPPWDASQMINELAKARQHNP